MEIMMESFAIFSVKLNRSGIDLQTRKGYYAAKRAAVLTPVMRITRPERWQRWQIIKLTTRFR